MLTHEYVHAVVRFIASANVAWWMNEGLAEEFSRPMDDARIARLKAAYVNGRMPSLGDLEGGQLGVRSGLALHEAYLTAHAAVHFLVERFGQMRMRNMLSRLAEGTDPAEALALEYRRSYGQLERELVQYYGLAN